MDQRTSTSSSTKDRPGLDEISSRLAPYNDMEGVRISKCETVINVGKSTGFYIKLLKLNPGSKKHLPYYEKLLHILHVVEGKKVIPS